MQSALRSTLTHTRSPLAPPGVQYLRPPSTDNVLADTRNFFAPVDEKLTQEMLGRTAEMALEKSDGAYVKFECVLPIAQAVGLFDWLNGDLCGDEIVWSLESLGVDEQLEYVTRLFGRRGFRFMKKGGGGVERTTYRVTMASRRFGCDTYRWNTATQVFSGVIANHRFNANGGAEAGAAITPAKPKQGDTRFSLTSLSWVDKASNPVDAPLELERKYTVRDIMVDTFGMDGTAL